MIIITIIITITITIIDKYTYIKIITIRRVGLVGPKNNEWKRKRERKGERKKREKRKQRTRKPEKLGANITVAAS